ncbi:MAG: site-specific integrase [Hyphomicrobiaceae bacterium]|nr:site-specific integrase [Hyphomicrobiaceae bacterium]
MRKLKTGTVIQTRYVVNTVDAATGQRQQFFFERLRDAQAKRSALIAEQATVRPAAAPDGAERGARAGDGEGSRVPTVAAGAQRHAPMPAAAGREHLVGDIVRYWLASLDETLKPSTRAYYEQMARYILVPIAVGSSTQRRKWAREGYPADVEMLAPLAPCRVDRLTTADIRTWHKTLAAQVGLHTANAAKKALGSALSRAAEELEVQVPAMPRQLGKGRTREKKRILTPEQVGRLIEAAQIDEERGIYYAFPFLTGVRPSEQLGLLWKDVDFAQGVIRIRRMQELDGSLCDITKSPAGNREVPMSPTLVGLLMSWRQRCPGGCEADQRVFTTLGTATSQRHSARGLPLTYANFRNSYWRPAFERLGLPYVSPHSARHTFISTLQANGIEVGLVAKLAGHANATVTLTHYTQAVRGGEVAVLSLEKAYATAPGPAGAGG